MSFFVCEFITGGGMQHEALPPKLVREGEMMLSSLLADLQDAGIQRPFCTRDSRLDGSVQAETITADDNVRDLWRKCMQRSETTWIIAPETDGILYELTRMALEAGCQVIGCAPEAIKLAERKRNTLVHLAAHQIPCIPAMHDFDAAAISTTGWVIKPDDGVGGEGCCFFTDAGAALSYTQTQIKDVVIQRYVPGISASMSLLCYGGQARLLAGNRQLFRFIDGKGVLEGVIVNGLPEYGGQLEVLALAIARAIPGLQGYVGVDVIISDAGPVVVEINPRLTTSYAGLRQALGANPAELILSAFNNCTMPEFEFSNPTPVTIKI